MAATPIFTYKDAIDHLVDYVGDNATRAALRDARRAAIDALRDLTNEHDWSYFVRRGRVNTDAPQSAGTVQYQAAGGALPRYVTLSGATWPSWAAYGQLVLDGVTYEVASVTDSTHLQLTIGTAPAADFAAGTSYTLYRDGYPLPCDFVAAERMQDQRRGVVLSYEAPRGWIARQRVYQGPSAPYTYTFTYDEHSYGAMAVRFFPVPDQVYPIDFIYKRKPRALAIDEYSAGTVSVTGGTAAVTGSGTAWTQAMVGGVIRLSADATNAPTGLAGANRAAEENIITAVASATSLTVDATIATGHAGVKYLISDPVDVEDGAMLTCYLRGCEAQGAVARIMKNEQAAVAAYQRAVVMAKQSDRRHLGMRVPGAPPHYIRLRDFAGGGDVG